MKSYTLRGITFQIQDNDRLKFMADARELYNTVAEDCFDCFDKELERQITRDTATRMFGGGWKG